MQREAARSRAGRDRRTEVLDAARQLFFEHGYRGTTVQQIAERAGYSKRTVYLDYLNKDDLFVTVCAEGGELILSQLRAIAVDELEVDRCLDRFVDVVLEFAQQHREYFRMIFNEATTEIIANCSADLRARVAELEGSCVGVVARWAERASQQRRGGEVDPWETAGMLTGAATGIIALSMGASQTVFSAETREPLVRKAVRALWRGLAPELAQAGATRGAHQPEDCNPLED